MTARLESYIVDWTASGQPDGAEALRVCLRFVEDAVTHFECDIPALDLDPPDVRRAAGVLLGAARKAHLPVPATGQLKAGDATVWEAFVWFAPHALDGGVWTSSGNGSPTVSFSDQGEAIDVHLDPDQAEHLQTALGPGASLVPLKEWRARRRERP